MKTTNALTCFGSPLIFPFIRTMSARCFPFLLILASTAGAGMEHRPAKKTLSTARAVRILSAEQADQRHLVEFRGVVTHANPHLGDFFMHDGTSPIYVHPQAEKKLTQGDLVHLTGFTSAGSFAPCVRAVKIG